MLHLPHLHGLAAAIAGPEQVGVVGGEGKYRNVEHREVEVHPDCSLLFTTSFPHCTGALATIPSRDWCLVLVEGEQARPCMTGSLVFY